LRDYRSLLKPQYVLSDLGRRVQGLFEHEFSQKKLHRFKHTVE
jgi:hypothetical protein